MKTPVRIFIIYAQEDILFKDELIKSLSPLKNQGLLESWHDGNIKAGQVWGDQIQQFLDEADIVMPLISSDFFASEHIQEVEIARAFERFNAKECIIVPVIVRACAWKADARLTQFQVLPFGGEAIDSWTRPNEAYAQIAKAIWKVIGNQTDKEEHPGPATNLIVRLKIFLEKYRWVILGLALLSAIWVFRAMIPHDNNKAPNPAEEAYIALVASPNIPKIKLYLNQFPSSEHAAELGQLSEKLNRDFKFHLNSSAALYRANERDKAFEEFALARDINPDAPEIDSLLEILNR